jgi:ADP-heptose:LPS heptosyltransferase
MNAKRRPIKILLQRADRLGDTIFTLPVIEALHNFYPNVQLDMVVSPIGAEIISGHPYITRYYVINGEKASTSDVKKLASSLIKESYDVYISLWNHPKMALLGKFAKIPVRIGDSSNPTLKWLYTHRIHQRWDDFTRHQVELNLELLTPLGIMNAIPKIHLHTDPDAVAKMQTVMKEKCAPDRKVIFIFSATGGTNLPIPEKAVMEFSEAAIKTGDYQIVIGGPRKAGSLFYDYEGTHFINMVGQTSMSELMALITLSDFYLGPDTGPSHIAAFFNKPMLFFSPIKPNPPSRWGPFTGYFSIVRREYVCRHTATERCTSKCLSWINGGVLWSHFKHLEREVMLNHELRFGEQKKWHLLNSYRVLAVATNNDEFRELKTVAKVLKKDGLVVFVIKLNGRGVMSLIKLINTVLRRNINVIHGRVPKWILGALSFYIGAVKAYTRPIYLPVTLNKYIEVDDLLEIYLDRWRNVKY